MQACPKLTSRRQHAVAPLAPVLIRRDARTYDSRHDARERADGATFADNQICFKHPLGDAGGSHVPGCADAGRLQHDEENRRCRWAAGSTCQPGQRQGNSCQGRRHGLEPLCRSGDLQGRRSRGASRPIRARGCHGPPRGRGRLSAGAQSTNLHSRPRHAADRGTRRQRHDLFHQSAGTLDRTICKRSRPSRTAKAQLQRRGFQRLQPAADGTGGSLQRRRTRKFGKLLILTVFRRRTESTSSCHFFAKKMILALAGKKSPLYKGATTKRRRPSSIG